MNSGGEKLFGRLPRSPRPSAPRRPDQTFRIALLGDFSGRTNRGLRRSADELAALRPLAVDRDNLDDRLNGMDVRLDNLLLAPGERLGSVEFRELDGFHPDRLYDRIGIFAALCALRQRLQNPTASSSAADELAKWIGDVSLTAPPPQLQHSAPRDEDDASGTGEEGLLDRILDNYAQVEPSSAERSEYDVTALIRDVVAPHAVQPCDPRISQLLRALDASLSLTMAAVLHHPAVRQLESAWRGVDFISRRLETDSTLQLYLIDVSQVELQADLLSTDQLADSGLYRLLVESSVAAAGGQPWSVLAGNYYFGGSPDEVAALGRIAKIASAGGAPFVTGSDGGVFGCGRRAPKPDADRRASQPSAAWEALRALSESEYLALMWPRFLLRLPYGRATRPIERFEFEEVSMSTSQQLLWGQPAFLAALALGQDFARHRWDVSPGRPREVADLPVWVDAGRSDPLMRPCTERLVSDSELQRIALCGITAVAAVRDRDMLLIPPIHSVSGSLLAGPWRK